MAIDVIGGGNVEPRALEDEMKSAYLDYAMSVIVGRALPDVRDGLKPVHRRVLYGMNDLGLQPNRPYSKCAKIVGEVMGNYHPHGDASIYDTLVRMAQDFSLRYPLVDGQGNFGSVDGDAAAAMRYCVSGETRVATPGGTRRLADLAVGMESGSERDVALTLLDRLARPVTASRLFHSGEHSTLCVRTREGYELTGTENHPVLCLVDAVGVPMLLWKLLEEIRPGDRVVLNRTPRPTGGELSADARAEAVRLGAWVCEGWAAEDRAGFDRDDLDGRDRFEPTGSALGPLTGPRVHAKRIPERVWGATMPYKRAFLQSLFTGDESSSLLPPDPIQISYSTSGVALAREVQQLLLEFGVISRLRRPGGRAETQVVITNRRDARLFSERVGLLGAKQARLRSALRQIPATSRALSGDHLPFVADFVRTETAGSAGAHWLRRQEVDRMERWQRDGVAIRERIADPEVCAVVDPLVTGDYHYAEVASIESAGVQPVYSLRVDSDDHAFLTDGFVSHNTEARLSRLATEMLRDLDMDTVDFVPNYDGSRREPTVLPARFPNLLVNGASGIAVGMATNIPPHNLREIVHAVNAYIDDPDISADALMQHVSGPDFPTGGIILGRQGIRDAYETGRGRVRVRAKVGVEDIQRGKEALIVTELPFQVRKGGEGGLITKIADLVNEKKIPEISDIRDESDRRGMRLVIELKRDALPKVVLNKLYKHTPMQSTFGVNMVALVDGVPRTLSLREVIHAYVTHQREVVVRRSKYELAQREARAHVLEGLLIALDNLDAIIELIRGSANREEARGQLMERFALSQIQAEAILALRLSQLTALETGEIKQEHADVMERIGELRALLGDESMVMALIKEELGELVDAYGDPRRTLIQDSEDELDIEDLIADQQMVITITHTGYIKALPLTTYRQQQRGGVGVTGMDMKDGDYIEHLFVCSSHDYLLFFSNRGKVYRSKVYELPEASRTSKGRALVNVLPLREGERIQSVVSTRDFRESQYLVFATKAGVIKKTEFLTYNTPIKADGIIAINIREDDELVAVRRVDPGDEVIMVSKAGLTVRFEEEQTRAMGRDTSGVRGMDVGPEGEVIAMDVARDEMELLVVTENGYGKRTKIDQYRKTSRGAKGVKTMGLTDTKGGLAGALVVRGHQDLVFISEGGMVQRTAVRGISQQGRSATGVRVMNVREDDRVSAVALVIESDQATTPEALEGLAMGPVDLSADAGGAEVAAADPATAVSPDDDTQEIVPDVADTEAVSDVEDDPDELGPSGS